MIIEIATAAMLSCAEARKIAHRIDPSQVSRREYNEIVRELKQVAPKNCTIANAGRRYKNVNHRKRNHHHHHHHSQTRVVLKSPRHHHHRPVHRTVVRDYRHQPIVIRPTLVWKF